MPLYERGDVCIHYEEAGAGFPLLVIPGGGLNSTIAGVASQTHPFNPFDAFKDEFRVIAADLRNAKGGSPQVRSRPTGRGTPIPMIISA
jgi:pimeloyl-ACP methyl ester carboxylesterase